VVLKWSVTAANRSYLLLPTVKKAEAKAPLAFIFPGKRNIFYVQTMQAYRRSTGIFPKTPSKPQQLMEISDQLHVLAALPPGEEGPDIY
jgi:hypothetical protein